MFAKVIYSRQMIRHFGPGWIFRRIGYLASQKASLLERRMKPVQWDDVPLESFLQDITLAKSEEYLAWRRTEPAPFFFRSIDCEAYRAFFDQWDRDTEDPVRAAADTVRGVMKFFGHHLISTGFPPDWHRNPMTSERAPSSRHWSRINEFAYGDIKTIWEMSRFAFVYPLVRAYWRSCDEIYA
ncbi:MAG TPA: hypothetical protein PLV84_01025, partial [Deltaproteobacteria bacterium]|nr:hypothetical protein [Deltaproteobacteria bacterium]